MKTATLYIGVFVALCVCVLLHSHADLSVDVSNKLSSPVTPLPMSARSVDVLKSELVFTQTPQGAARLLDYLKSLERNLLLEKKRRKVVMAKLSNRLERNAKYAHAQRTKMRLQLRRQIAANAKRSQAELWKAMRKSQQDFAVLETQRNRLHAARGSARTKLLKLMAKNKREIRRNLRNAVVVQQRALAASAQSMNAKIRQNDKHLSANSIQIGENAKHAHKALNKVVKNFNFKLNNARAEAQKGTSKLAVQLSAQLKRTRQAAASAVLGLVASTANKFRRVRLKMAQQRRHVDNSVQHMTSKFMHALQRHRATFSRHEKRTGAALQQYRAKTTAALRATRARWKASMMRLSAVVKRQDTKLMNRLGEVSNVVVRQRDVQARVNRRAMAEIKRITAVGVAREAKQKKVQQKMTASERLLKRQAKKSIERSRIRMNQQLDKVKKQLRKARAPAAKKLRVATARLYKTLAANEANQKKFERSRSADIAQMRAGTRRALQAAKRGFRSKLTGMARTMAQSQRRMQVRLRKMTGIVTAAAVKDHQARAALKTLMDAQRTELQGALSKAVEAGKKRARNIQKRMRQIDAKSRASVAMQLSATISSFKKQTQRSVDQFRLSDKKSLAIMHKSLLASLRKVEAEASKATAHAVRGASSTLARQEVLARRAMTQDAAQRAQLSAAVMRARHKALAQMRRAMATQQQVLVLQQLANQKKIDKANARVGAMGARMAQAVARAENKFVVRGSAKLRQAAARFAVASRSAITEVQRQDLKQNQRVMEFCVQQNRLAAARLKGQFRKFYGGMAKERSRQDQLLAAATANFNSALTKSVALTNNKFAGAVKKLSAAKEAARKQLRTAQAEFRTRMASVTAYSRRTEQQIRGSLAVVTKQVTSNRGMQAAVNRRVKEGLARVINLSNLRFARSKRARGTVLRMMTQDAQNVAKMVNAEARLMKRQVSRINRRMASYTLQQRVALSRATTRLAKQLASDKRAAALDRKQIKLVAQADRIRLAAARKRAQSHFSTTLNVLANTVAAQARSRDRELAVLTKTVKRQNAASKQELGRLRQRRVIMRNDLNRDIVRAIQLGQTRLQGVARRAAKTIKQSTSMLRAQLSSKIAQTSDMLVQAIQGKQQHLADNYLSAKAYCVAARTQFNNYERKSGKVSLLSISDWCSTVAALSNARVISSPGIGMGLKTIPAPFSSKKFKVSGELAKINALVAEYMRVLKQVQARWGIGLGRYFIKKLQSAMLVKGILQVSNSNGASFVFLNGRKLGLSTRLPDLQGLRVKMPSFASALAQLTARLAAPPKAGKKQRL